MIYSFIFYSRYIALEVIFIPISAFSNKQVKNYSILKLVKNLCPTRYIVNTAYINYLFSKGCPYANGVCCPGSAFCCPENNSCGKNPGECVPNKLLNTPYLNWHRIEVKAKHFIENLIEKTVQTPEACAKGTQCTKSDGSLDCCPYVNGTCCGSDGYCW